MVIITTTNEPLQLTDEELRVVIRRREALLGRRDAVFAAIEGCPSSIAALVRELKINNTYVKVAVKELVTAGRVFPLPGKVRLAGRGRPTTVYAATKVEKARVTAPGVSIRREPIWVCVNLAAEQGAPCTRCNACGQFGKEVRTR